MKKILILTSKVGWDLVEFSLKKGFKTINEKINDIHVAVMSDNCGLDDIKKYCGEDSPPDFLAYHKTALENGTTKNDILNDSYLEKCFSKPFSHRNYRGEFYKEILPKIYTKKDITLAEIEKYFPSPLELSLSLLHNIYSGVPKSEFYKKEIYGELIKEAKADKIIDSLTDDWCYSENKNEVLNDLRDKLLTYATKH